MMYTLISLPIAHILHFPILFFQLPLHLEVQLTLTFQPLLFHIADDALMHCLTESQR